MKSDQDMLTSLEENGTHYEHPEHASSYYGSETTSEQHEGKTSSQWMASELGLENEASRLLEKRLSDFQEYALSSLKTYADTHQERKPLVSQGLYFLQGWQKIPSKKPFPDLFWTQQASRHTGGVYLRWNNKGIVINPGAGFLCHFHEKGLHVRDIDYVIVTKGDPASCKDVREIYEINTELNKHSSHFHLIHYYLNPQSYLELSSYLKPNFKQERFTVHRLELFVDSPDVEKIEIGDGITLNYFPLTQKEAFLYGNDAKEDAMGSLPHSSLGIRLDLMPAMGEEEKCQRRVGYVSGTPWSPLLAHHIGPCDVLVTGFGHTSSSDYSRLNYNDDCLGYFGCYSLLEEIRPKILLFGEMSGKNGDIRLEVSKKMRYDWAANNTSDFQPAVLPGDIDLFLDLVQLKIECSISGNLADPEEIRVIKQQPAFGELSYLSSDCLL